MSFFRCLSILCLLCLTGCATHTYGTNTVVNPEIISQIHAGTSTTDDLRRLLGAPTEVEARDAGRELWIYRYVEYQGTYVPLLGAVSTGERQESLIKFYIENNRVERLERLQTRHSNGL